MRDRVDPSYDVEAAFRAFAYAGTPIARPVLGTEASLGAITRSQALAYYKKRYVPANITFESTGSMAILQTIEPVIGVSSRAHVAPPSSVR